MREREGGGLVPVDVDIGDRPLRGVDEVSVVVARGGRGEQVTSRVERVHAAPWEKQEVFDGYH